MVYCAFTLQYHLWTRFNIPKLDTVCHFSDYSINLAWHGMASHAMPCHAMPCHAMPCHAMPCHAMPCHAMPCHAMPCHAMPCHAMPCHAMPCTSRVLHSEKIAQKRSVKAHCLIDRKGTDYLGWLNRTTSGISCQQWESDSVSQMMKGTCPNRLNIK